MDMVQPFINWFGMMISLTFCIAIVRQQASNVQKWLMLTFVCGFVTVVGNTMEFYATSVDIAMTAVKTAYIGKIYMLLFALMFAVEFTGIKTPKHPFLVLGALDTVFLTCIMTNDHHLLFYSSVELVAKADEKFYLVSGKGPLYYVVMGQMILCIFAFAQLIIKGTRRGTREAKIRTTLLVISAFMVLFLLGITMSDGLENYDPTTFIITVIEIIIMVSVKRYGLLDTKQVVQESALEATQEGLILVDEKKHLIYANNVARSLFHDVDWNDAKLVLDDFFKEREWVLDKDGHQGIICFCKG